MSRQNSNLGRPDEQQSRQIDPDVARKARQSGVPDGSLYDFSVDRTGPSNWYLLIGVLVVVGVLLAIFLAFY